MHDKNGTPLQTHDRVTIEFEVAGVYGDSDACNCQLVSVLPMPNSGEPLWLGAVNTRQTLLVHRPPRAT